MLNECLAIARQGEKQKSKVDFNFDRRSQFAIGRKEFHCLIIGWVCTYWNVRQVCKIRKKINLLTPNQKHNNGAFQKFVDLHFCASSFNAAFLPCSVRVSATFAGIFHFPLACRLRHLSAAARSVVIVPFHLIFGFSLHHWHIREIYAETLSVKGH